MFYVGQRVVLVNDNWPCKFPTWNRPVKGIVYTVRKVEFDAKGAGLLLHEIINNEQQWIDDFGEKVFAAWRFRPVTDISTLQAIVAEVKTGKPRKIKADEFDKQKAGA